MSCRVAKHCLFLLFRVYLKKAGLFQEHERRYFNMHSSEVFISRDNFGCFSQSFQWTACKLLWPISHKLALSPTCLPVNKILFALFLSISTYLSFRAFRNTNKNLIFFFTLPNKMNISPSCYLSVFSMLCLVFDWDNVFLDYILYLKPLSPLHLIQLQYSQVFFLALIRLTPIFCHW